MFDRPKLRKAIEAGDTSTVTKVIARHPDWINLPVGDYARPLSIALAHGQKEMVTHLLALGARTDVRGSRGPNMLYDAVQHGWIALAKAWAQDNPALLQRSEDATTTLLHIAAMRNDTQTLEWLLAAGLDPAALNWRGLTALQLAEQDANESAIAVLKPYREKSKIADKRAAQQVIVKTEGQEKWSKLDDHRIACVRHEPAIGYRITAIFNFATSERTRIYRNVETDQESVETMHFDIAGAAPDIETARTRLLAAGGKPGSHAPATAIVKRGP